MRRLFSVVGMLLSIVIVMAGCGGSGKARSPVLEGRRGQWLTDGRLGVRAIDFHESFGGMGGPFMLGGGVSLGMTYELANLGASSLTFDRIGIVFHTTSLAGGDDFSPTANTVTVIKKDGLTTYFGGPFGEEPKLPAGKHPSFVLPPSKGAELEVSGDGTPLQLIVQHGIARRDYKVVVTLFSADGAYHGPFTINVTATEGRGRKLVFK